MTTFKFHIQPFSMLIDKKDMPTDEQRYEVRHQVDSMMKALSNGTSYLGSSGFTTSYEVDSDDMTVNSVIQAVKRANEVCPKNISILCEFY